MFRKVKVWAPLVSVLKRQWKAALRMIQRNNAPILNRIFRAAYEAFEFNFIPILPFPFSNIPPLTASLPTLFTPSHS